MYPPIKLLTLVKPGTRATLVIDSIFTDKRKTFADLPLINDELFIIDDQTVCKWDGNFLKPVFPQDGDLAYNRNGNPILKYNDDGSGWDVFIENPITVGETIRKVDNAMKLINIFKTKEYGTGEETLYISTGDGYFPRFGSFPIQHGQLFKFTEGDRLWVWTGDMLRPVIEFEGDIAYDHDGRRCAKYINGRWQMNSGTIGLGDRVSWIDNKPASPPTRVEVEIGIATESTLPLLINSVPIHVNPIQFVR